MNKILKVLSGEVFVIVCYSECSMKIIFFYMLILTVPHY